MLFRSEKPDIEFPTSLTVWEFVFEDGRYSPFGKIRPEDVAGFTNGATKERLNFLQVRDHATHLSTALVKHYGMQVGDTVSLFSQNSIWYPVVMFATLRVGGRVNGASPAYSVNEMTHALKTANSKFFITVPASIEIAKEAASKAGIPKDRIFLLEGELDGYVTLKQLLKIGESYGKSQIPSYHVPQGQSNQKLCGFLNFSSGTTGFPKAVMISHGNVIAQIYQLRAVSPGGHQRFLAQIPLFHISGLVRFLSWPIFNNDECIMLPMFTMELFLKAIEEYRVTDLTLVPPLVIRLVQDPIVDKYDLSSVKRISSSSAPLSWDIIGQLQKKMPWAGFRQSYGMTESCGSVSTHPPEFYGYEYARSVGKLLPSTVAKIVDPQTGKELGVDEVGEILLKGPQITLGYLGNSKETAESFDVDGFIHSGDIGRIDGSGFLHIVDRIKELIKVKGQQVAPAELEDLLLSHSAVADCAVLGMPDDYSGERPKAYVVLKPGCQPSYSLGLQLLEYVQKRRVPYKWFKEVEFVASIPKNPSGKILRRVLKKQAENGSEGITVSEKKARGKL